MRPLGPSGSHRTPRTSPRRAKSSRHRRRDERIRRRADSPGSQTNAASVEEVATTIEQMSKGTARARERRPARQRTDERACECSITRTEQAMKTISARAPPSSPPAREETVRRPSNSSLARTGRSPSRPASLETAFTRASATPPASPRASRRSPPPPRRTRRRVDAGAAGIEQVARSAALGMTKSARHRDRRGDEPCRRPSDLDAATRKVGSPLDARSRSGRPRERYGARGRHDGDAFDLRVR